jgi:hypothetical protein
MVQSLIQYFPYAIRSQGPRNAHDQISHQNGVLLKIENGYACLHPHPALGEPSLDDLIEDKRSHFQFLEALHFGEKFDRGHFEALGF